MSACILSHATAASAQDQVIRFEIPRQSVGDALIALAQQARISLGGDLRRCGEISAPLRGRMTIRAAVGRLLEGSACTFEFPDAQTLVIHGPRPPPKTSAAAARRGATRAQPPMASPVVAPAAPALETAVSEIVVTAERRSDLAGRSPLSISAVSSRRLEESGAVDLTELATGVASMTITNLGPGRNKVHLRGLSDGVFTGSTQSTVALYLNDAPVTYSAPDPDLRLVDIDRVEVIRGPQGTLYGVGSMGGIVRVVTRRPDLDQYFASAEAGLEVTHEGDPSFETEGVLNLPIVKGRVALRLVGYGERRGGYIDDINLGLNNVNSVSRNGARAALRASLTPDWTLTVSGAHQTIETADTQYAFKRLGPLERANNVQEPHSNGFDEFAVTLEGQIPWGHLTVTSEKLLHRLHDRFDASAALPAFGRPPGMAEFDESRRVDTWVNEFALASPQLGRLRWLVGAFSSTGQTDFGADLTRRRRSGVPRLGYTEDRFDRIDELAVYGEATYDLSPRLAMTAGARWFRFSYATDSLVTQDDARRAFEGQGENSGLSPKLQLRFQAAERVMLYGSITEGYRPGGFNTSGIIGQSFDGEMDHPAQRYDPDHLWNFEVGTKIQSAQGRFQLRAAAFYAHWDAIQTDQFLRSGLPYTVNAGTGANIGLEAEFAWRMSSRLELRLAGLINDPKITDPSPRFAVRADAGLPGVPDGSASAGFTYRRPVGTDLTLVVDGEAAYVGPSRLTFDAQRIYDMGDYGTGRLSVALEAAKWRLSGYVDNPFDSRANTFAFGNPFRIGRTREATPLRPRTLGMTVSGHF